MIRLDISGSIWKIFGRLALKARLLFNRHPPKTESLELEDAQIDFDQAWEIPRRAMEVEFAGTF